jgi:outer membrane protein OmpA-like peptidoglycan-associated protein
MRIKQALTIFLSLICAICFSQTKPGKLTVAASKPISADCKKAIPILLNSNVVYGQTLPTNGFGELQEFKTNNSSTFEGEHNSAWYLLSVTRNGELAFDIIPLDTTNDYDFLLYAYTDSTFCDALHKNKLKPARSNLSNITKSVKGITGLKPNTLKNSIGEGIGIAYSKSIDVKKGEKYMLVLDNITPEGKGHIIRFYFMKEVEIKGKVVDSDSIPTIADIILTDNQGKTIEETKSDKEGNYSLKTSIIENQNYNLSIASDSTFVQSTTINTKTLRGATVFPGIKTVLPKLRKGNKYKLGNINFYGNESTLLPESFPSVDALCKLMKRNKTMMIQIEGHVNDPNYYGRPKLDPVRDARNQTLSNERAKAIYDFLTSKGIEKDRMKYVGLSNKDMLFKNPKNEEEQSANRRVEIKVISID